MSTTWHRNTAVEVRGLSVQQQLEKSGLNWRVDISPVQYEACVKGVRTVRIDKKRKVAYRSDNGALLDIYNSRKAFQNDQILLTFNQFCQAAGLEISHVGHLNEGRLIYCAAPLGAIAPEQDGDDESQAYLILEDSHRTGKGLQVWLFLERLVCSNGMKVPVYSDVDVVSLAQRGANIESWAMPKHQLRSISHRSEYRSDQVHEILKAARNSLDYEALVLSKLASESMSTEQAAVNLIAAFGDPSKSYDDQPGIVKTTLRLFQGEGLGSDRLTAYNTAYGLLHSVTEFFNHHVTSRGNVNRGWASLFSGDRRQKVIQFQQQLIQSVGV